MNKLRTDNGREFLSKTFKISSSLKAFGMSSLLPTHLSRILLLNVTTELWWKALAACCIITPCLFNFGVRQSTRLSMFLIEFRVGHYMVIPHIPSGMESNLMSAIFECLEVYAMHIYPNLFGENLIAKRVSAFLWGTV